MRERLGASEAAVESIDDDIQSSSDSKSKAPGNKKQKGIATALFLFLNAKSDHSQGLNDERGSRRRSLRPST